MVTGGGTHIRGMQVILIQIDLVHTCNEEYDSSVPRRDNILAC